MIRITSSGLSFYAESESDTVLLINDPDGEWYCNDDYSDELGLASGLDFSSPQSGVYDIWVGSYEDEFSSATLYVTELGYLIDPEAEGSDTDNGDWGSASSGTAFFVSESGHLITNFHVPRCSSIQFQLPENCLFGDRDWHQRGVTSLYSRRNWKSHLRIFLLPAGRIWVRRLSFTAFRCEVIFRLRGT